MGILIQNKGLSGRFKISGNSTGGFKARYVAPPVFDTDAQAFFDRVTAAGGTLTETEKTAVNTMTLSFKSAGVWTLMRAIYPMVGSSSVACAQNLKSSSFTGTFSSGWTYTSTGVTPNGSSTFMDTTLVPSTSLASNSGHLSIYIRTNVEEQTCDIGTTNGAFGAADEMLLMSRYTTFGFIPVYTQFNSGIANLDSRGLYITNRNSSSNTTGFKNNTKVYDTTQGVGTLPTLSITLGCQNATAKTRFASKQYAFASIGDGLTDPQALDFYTAVQAFQTTLSRQV